MIDRCGAKCAEFRGQIHRARPIARLAIKVTARGNTPGVHYMHDREVEDTRTGGGCWLIGAACRAALAERRARRI